MTVLQIKALGLFIELHDSSIVIEGKSNLTIDFKNDTLASFWFESLLTQVESLDEFAL
ncbi:hypothetical protein NE293_04545 [Latilactobacillus curvatus]|uniref:hypothetical protein n=1 Tax=Latilactobacillus curvatus TaxID=28038 RepID=UPI00207478CE|nr:hypothetical protein [Latilactobacillus curvatus]WEU69620.1 hypothetical protein [Latilactobacillus phage TMW 1.1365 P3]MCM6843944.1 hypothetical protein [Latilactobacillus curvatus]MCM6861169.1 hypothetical protein [Latilactobacillus curvatus]MCM6868467.1 hypothetical protein [Latilactobacillus curvatus]MDG2981214.1 hypothetical protein [Latilactobacillus curvatus]